MSLTLYYGSGSGPAWRVWLSLEYKKIPYDLKVLSFSDGDLRKPEFIALNPRHKVPTIVDDDFVLYESVAIVEYLDQRCPEPSLFPKDARAAAVVRRIVQEADSYLSPTISRLSRQTLFRPNGDGDPKEIAEARALLIEELERFESIVAGDYVCGANITAADFTLYPMLAMIRRIGSRMPQHSLDDKIGPKVTAWMKRIESLPFFEKTIPPHWKS